MSTLKFAIKEKIQQHGISAHALERMAGLKPSAVQNILYGRSKNPSVTTIQAIANALGCDIRDLLSNDSATKPSSASANLPWDQRLYIECANIVGSVAGSHDVHLSKSDIIEVVDEVYEYSISNDLKKPDINFTKWIIEKSK